MKSSDFYCKRHILAWKHVVRAILRECPLRGLTPRAEIEKSQKVSDFHRNDVSPLTRGLRYRAACDNESTTALQLHSERFRKNVNDETSNKNFLSWKLSTCNWELFLIGSLCSSYSENGIFTANLCSRSFHRRRYPIAWWCHLCHSLSSSRR